jgi:type I restriction enzyme S subunit
VQKASGGGQPNISQDVLKSLWTPIPSFQEQQEIADYLDRKCTEIDALIDKKTELLTELETFKKSLIYEYVTGKKEVE